MLIDDFVEIRVNGNKTINKLTNLGIDSKKGDVIKLEINKLWKGSNLKVNAKCDVCGNKKSIQFNLYNKNIKLTPLVVSVIGAVVLYIVCGGSLMAGGFNPFIYFRF